MDVDELIDKFISDDTAVQQQSGTATSDVAQKRERLCQVIAGGQAERYLGRALSLDQVDKLSASEIEKLYARYEMCLGASMSKTLGHAVLNMYSDLAAFYRPKINPSSLAADLEANPLVELGISRYSGSIYHMFGLYLAPFAALLITFKHCKFGEEEDGDTGPTVKSGDQTEVEGP